MKHTWVVALALVACSGKKDGDKAKAKPTDELQEDPLCAEKMPPFAEWMKALVADGKIDVVVSGVELATIGGTGPGQVTRGAPVVVVKPAEIIVEGTVVADPSKTAGAELAKLVVPQLESKPGADLVIAIDGKVAWSTVQTVLNATLAAKHPRLTLVFAAGAPPAASPPPKSAIDAELDAMARPADPAKPAPSAAAPADPTRDLAAKVFKDCAAITQKLFPAIDKLGPSEFEVAVAVGMPEEIGLCGCRVDLPSVQRLMWAWWGRDRGPALTGVRIEIAATPKEGTDLTMKPEVPWSEASQLVLAAAEQRKPIAPH